MKAAIALLLSLLLHGASCQEVQMGDLVVKGRVLKDTLGGEAHAYIGIPFAAPPVGDLRFAAPQPYQYNGDDNVIDATRGAPACLQDLSMISEVKFLMDIMLSGGKEYYSQEEFSEDCLFLNVFAPAAPSEKPRPVMVWIHGGGFSMGSIQGYDGRTLSTTQDVIVVAIQYRLGAYGFLSTEDDGARGNWGIRDQVMGLKWVQDNIKYFGGDPNQVTIFGESAGAVSVGMLSVSPHAKGLFHRGICHSGTEAMDVLYDRTSLKSATILGESVGCAAGTNEELLKCLRGADAEVIDEIVRAASAEAFEKVKEGANFFEAMTLSFSPRFDEDVLLSMPEGPNDVDLIVGYNNDEFGFLMGSAMGTNDPINREEMSTKIGVMAGMLSMGSEEYTKKFLDVMLEVYTPSHNENKNKHTTQQLFADSMFKFPALLKADKHVASGNKVWMYELTNGPALLRDHALIDGSKIDISTIPEYPADIGADHGDDIIYTFGVPFNPSFVESGYSNTEEEKNFSRFVMGLWGSFARGADPHAGWPAYSTETPKILRLDYEKPVEVFQSLGKLPMCVLWGETIPQMFGEMFAAMGAGAGEGEDAVQDEL